MAAKTTCPSCGREVVVYVSPARVETLLEAAPSWWNVKQNGVFVERDSTFDLVCHPEPNEERFIAHAPRCRP